MFKKMNKKEIIKILGSRYAAHTDKIRIAFLRLNFILNNDPQKWIEVNFHVFKGMNGFVVPFNPIDYFKNDKLEFTVSKKFFDMDLDTGIYHVEMFPDTDPYFTDFKSRTKKIYGGLAPTKEQVIRMDTTIKFVRRLVYDFLNLIKYRRFNANFNYSFYASTADYGNKSFAYQIKFRETIPEVSINGKQNWGDTTRQGIINILHFKL